MKHWHNTTKEPNKSELDQRAQSQEEKILAWFKEHPGTKATPFGVKASCMLSNPNQSAVPITSVRRAMSNLTRDGKLEKTSKKVVEVYGISNYLWRLKERQLELF